MQSCEATPVGKREVFPPPVELLFPKGFNGLSQPSAPLITAAITRNRISISFKIRSCAETEFLPLSYEAIQLWRLFVPNGIHITHEDLYSFRANTLKRQESIA
jgi:hypothetical protein